MRFHPASLVVAVVAQLAVTVSAAAAAADCNRHIYSHLPTSGIIESPAFPSPYRSGIDCVYNLTSSPSSVIHLTFVSFDLAPIHRSSGQCLEAYVIIIVVDRQGKEHVGERLCGSELPRKIETMQPTVYIQFATTAANGRHRGFRIQYDMLSEAAIREPRSFISPEDRPLEGDCGGRNEPGQLTGEIVSPGYPFTFPRNCSCNWLIRVEPRQRIYIRLVLLHLSSTIAECERASLTIIDGYKHESSTERKETMSNPSEARFCGSQMYYSEEGMKSYMSTANRLLLRLTTTDRPSSFAEGQRVGFKVIWTAVEGLVEDSDSLSALSPDEPPSITVAQCDQFVCKGGKICVEQGHGVCASRSQLCIHSSLVCNGIQNCVEGDYSDEQHCYSREIIIASVCGLCAVLLIISVCVCCDHWRKKRRLHQMIRERRSQNGKGPVSENNGGRPPRAPRRSSGRRLDSG